MPKPKKTKAKKGGKSKKGKLKKGTSKSTASIKSVPTGPSVTIYKDNFVTLNMKLAHWEYMDFKLKVPITTPLFVIKRRIIQRFGPLEKLELYRDGTITEDTKIEGEMETLEELGLIGKLKSLTKNNSSNNNMAGGKQQNHTHQNKEEEEEEEDDEGPSTTIMFDYKPLNADNTLLLVDTSLRDTVGSGK